MAYVPQYFQASTRDVAEKALAKGLLKYPSLVFVQDTASLLWLDESEKYFHETTDEDQITNVTCDDDKLNFYHDETLLYSVTLPSGGESPSIGTLTSDEITSLFE